MKKIKNEYPILLFAIGSLFLLSYLTTLTISNLKLQLFFQGVSFIGVICIYLGFKKLNKNSINKIEFLIATLICSIIYLFMIYYSENNIEINNILDPYLKNFSPFWIGIICILLLLFDSKIAILISKIINKIKEFKEKFKQSKDILEYFIQIFIGTLMGIMIGLIFLEEYNFNFIIYCLKLSLLLSFLGAFVLSCIKQKYEINKILVVSYACCLYSTIIIGNYQEIPYMKVLATVLGGIIISIILLSCDFFEKKNVINHSTL